MSEDVKGLTVIAQRPVIFFHVCVSDSPVVVGVCRARIEGNDFIVVLDGVLVLFQFKIGKCPAAVKFCIFGMPGYDSAEVRNSLSILSVSVISQSAVEICLIEAGAYRDHAAVSPDGLCIISLIEMAVPSVEVELRVLIMGGGSADRQQQACRKDYNTYNFHLAPPSGLD
ncbi:MAG: hypothetical protein P8Z71_11210 [Candidatus Sulfobium sp.]